MMSLSLLAGTTVVEYCICDFYEAATGTTTVSQVNEAFCYFDLMLYVLVNNVSVMLGTSTRHRHKV